MWVTGTDYYGEIVAVNLDKVSFIDVGDSYIRFTAERQSDVKKTPDLMFQLWSAIPGLAVGQHTVQPVVPAEPEGPFRITGLGLYEMENGESVRISEFDKTADDGVPWVSDNGCWYQPDGVLYAVPRSDGRHIVKLIKLDEVQP